VDLALLQREVTQAAALQAAALQQRLRTLAERAAAATAQEVNVEAHTGAAAAYECSEGARRRAAEEHASAQEAGDLRAQRVQLELDALERGARPTLPFSTLWHTQRALSTRMTHEYIVARALEHGVARAARNKRNPQ
jgi:hypothetical protein